MRRIMWRKRRKRRRRMAVATVAVGVGVASLFLVFFSFIALASFCASSPSDRKGSESGVREKPRG